MANLADLGMPFALYKGAVETISQLIENATCATCAASERYLFGVNRNDHVTWPCPGCSDLTAVKVGWLNEAPVPSTCNRCAGVVHWPADLPRDNASICYRCLRAGRAAMDHETEMGSIDLPHALRGVTYLARRKPAQREGLAIAVLETHADGSESIGVQLEPELLQEMLRTPRHAGLQGEYWPYHCRSFMAYLGRWQQEDFEQAAPGRGRQWFGEHMDDDAWEDMWEWLPTNVGWSYVFQCQACGRHRVFVDSD